MASLTGKGSRGDALGSESEREVGRGLKRKQQAGKGGLEKPLFSSPAVPAGGRAEVRWGTRGAGGRSAAPMGTEEGWCLLLYLALSGVVADPGEWGSLAGGRGAVMGPRAHQLATQCEIPEGERVEGRGRGLPPKPKRKEAGKVRQQWCWGAGRKTVGKAK